MDALNGAKEKEEVLPAAQLQPFLGRRWGCSLLHPGSRLLRLPALAGGIPAETQEPALPAGLTTSPWP